MRFVPVKSEEQQGMLMVHRTRDLLVRQHTATVNALRGDLAEFGIIAAKGTARARELMSIVGTDERVPAIARHALLQLVEQIRDTERKIEAFDKQILSLARENEVCRRLMSVLTIGPFAATALAATVGNPRHFHLRSPLCSLDRLGPETVFDRWQRAVRRHQQARRRLSS
jgi:transposase